MIFEDIPPPVLLPSFYLKNGTVAGGIRREWETRVRPRLARIIHAFTGRLVVAQRPPLLIRWVVPRANDVIASG